MTVAPLLSDQIRIDNTTTIESPGWTGRKTRVRRVEITDRPALTGFDRLSVRVSALPTVGGHRHWAAHRTDPTDSHNAQFAIETLHSRMIVGSMSIQADHVRRTFSYSIGIGPLHRRCGYARDAVAVLLTNMFRHDRFRRCEVVVHSGNLGSLTLHGVLGFRETARTADTDIARGAIKLMVTLTITAQEFTARNEHLVASPLSPRGRHWQLRRGRHWNGPGQSLLF
ncbi:GNAT family N-acetyltransferase [Nocardia fusca]|uniref:GNAT family N-acetyltransferase n=1 Tax=Nocardia fusca TaxID=941183 RepID=UPI0037C59B15